MKAFKIIFSLLVIVVIDTFCSRKEVSDIPPNKIVPTVQQIVYQQMEFIGFVHFGVNTYTDREWGTGKEDPVIFDPEKLDPDQWAGVAKKAGMGELIITAKHHDGFCLWPSAFTDHSVKSSNWENGKGDVVKLFSEACRKEGIKMGIYLSPWDMHEPVYGTVNYNKYYLSQLRELLTNYGKVSEVWMDGAKGPNAKDMEYDFPVFRKLIYELQPDALIFSDAGPDIRWIGNEKGIAGTTNWSMINNQHIEIGKADTKLLNSGDPEGNNWLTGECDVSIRPGWFYHASQDSLVKSPQELVDLYYKSVGRNANFLLNIPPDKDGRWHEQDVKSLLEFRSIIDETFNKNLARNQKVRASDWRMKNEKFSPKNINDTSLNSYWSTNDNTLKSWLELELEEPVTFDRVMIQEPIRFGQRISGFTVEAMVDGNWMQIAEGTTVGYKRLLRFEPVTTDKVRLNITESNNIPAISNFGLYKSSSREPGVN